MRSRFSENCSRDADLDLEKGLLGLFVLSTMAEIIHTGDSQY